MCEGSSDDAGFTVAGASTAERLVGEFALTLTSCTLKLDGYITEVLKKSRQLNFVKH